MLGECLSSGSVAATEALSSVLALALPLVLVRVELPSDCLDASLVAELRPGGWPAGEVGRGPSPTATFPSA